MSRKSPKANQVKVFRTKARELGADLSEFEFRAMLESLSRVSPTSKKKSRKKSKEKAGVGAHGESLFGANGKAV
jgi:hypothetical protein